MTEIILATTSRPRIEAFKNLNIPFITEGSDVDEYTADRPKDPKELVLYLSRKKAEAVAKKYSQGIIIGFDSLGYFNGQILEKPKSRDEAYSRLKALSGNTHEFYTGVCLINKDKDTIIQKFVMTKAHIRNLSEREIEKYLSEDDKYTKIAPGYDPLGAYSCSFVDHIEGSYNSLLRGIPLETIAELLKETGFKI